MSIGENDLGSAANGIQTSNLLCLEGDALLAFVKEYQPVSVDLGFFSAANKVLDLLRLKLEDSDSKVDITIEAYPDTPERFLARVAFHNFVG